MRTIARVFCWLGAALGLLLAILLGAFGVLQTRVGQASLAETVAQTVSSPDFAVSVEGLHGIVPFHFTIDRIDIADRDGTYITLRDFGLDISAAALLAGRLEILSLSFAELEMARSSTAPSTTPLTGYFNVPRLPVSVILDRLSPPVLGESLVATVDGNGRVAGETATVALYLHRTDGAAGSVELAMELAGAPPILRLQLEANEPTGVLVDRLLGRTDRPPFALSLKGTGPLADWHGRVVAAAGTLAHFDADVTLAVATQIDLGLSGTVAIAPLLPAEITPLIGDQFALSLHATLGDRIVVDPLSIGLAAGTVTGDAAVGGPDKAIVAHLRASCRLLRACSGANSRARHR